MEVSRVVALRGPGLAWLSNRPPPNWRLASEQGACLPGPRRGEAKKGRERHKGPGIGRARHGLVSVGTSLRIEPW